MSIIQRGDILLSESSLIEEKIASLYGQISRTRKESVSKHSCPIITSWPAVSGAGSQGTIGGWSPLVAGPGTMLHCSTRPRPGHTATTTCTNTDQQPRGQYQWIPYIISVFVCTAIIFIRSIVLTL